MHDPPVVRRLERADAARATLVSATAALLYLCTLQERPYSDGASLLTIVQHAEARPDWLHPLYVWLGHGLRRLAPDVRAFDLLRGVSVVGGAIAVGATFLLARMSGARCAAAAAGAALFATAPAVWFFSTTVELHALHAACVMLAACVVVLAPWHRPVLATVIAALPLLLVLPSHLSGALLGPGYVLLARWGATLRGVRVSWRASVLGIAPVFAAALVGGAAMAQWIRGGTGSGLADGARYASDVWLGPSWRMVSEGWLGGLAMLVPAALWGGRRAAHREWFLSIAVSIAPSLAFFLLFGFAELGAYFVATAPFYALLATRMPPGRATVALAAVSIALHVGISLERIHRFNGGEWAAAQHERLAAIDEVAGDGGAVVLVVDPRTPCVESVRPNVRELSLWSTLLRHQARGATFEQFAEHWQPHVSSLMAPAGAWILLDRHYARDLEHAGQHRPWLLGIEIHLAREYHITDVSAAGWPMWRIDQRSP